MRRNIFPGDHLDIVETFKDLERAYSALGEKENILQGLQYRDKGLKMLQRLFPDKNPDVVSELLYVGDLCSAFGREFEEKDNIRKGIKYKEYALEMLRESPGKDFNIIPILDDLGNAYRRLGGKENVRKGLDYYEESLKVRRKEFPGDDFAVAMLLEVTGWAYVNELGEKEGILKGLSLYEEALKIERASRGNHILVADLSSTIGLVYATQLEGEENIRKGLKYAEEALKMYQQLFPNGDQDMMRLLAQMGGVYKTLKSAEDSKKSLICDEAALKMQQTLFSGNNLYTAVLLNDTGLSYHALRDREKALEYFKQAYSVITPVSEEEKKIEKIARSNIEANQRDFFTKIRSEQDCFGGNKVGPECRWIISSRGKTDEDLIKIKQKIRFDLGRIIRTTDDRLWGSKPGWSRVGLFGEEFGVKGYLEKEYLKSQLGEFGNKNENVELAQMLCFEAMNLAIMDSENKPYEVVKSFTRENAELVKKIAIEHPEFFVDGSIVEACIRAMPGDESFQQHIFDHVKYMGMEERREKFFKTASGF